MPGLIAHCRPCGLYFEPPDLLGIAPGSKVRVQVRGSRVNCPNGHMADLIDGTYDFEGPTLKAVQALDPSQQIVLLSILNKAKKSASKSDLEALSTVSPEIGAVVQTMLRGNWPLALILLLLFISLRECGGISLNETNHYYSEAINNQSRSGDVMPSAQKQKEKYGRDAIDDTGCETSADSKPEGASVQSESHGPLGKRAQERRAGPP